MQFVECPDPFYSFHEHKGVTDQLQLGWQCGINNQFNLGIEKPASHLCRKNELPVCQTFLKTSFSMGIHCKLPLVAPKA